MQALGRIEIERACEQLSIAYARHLDFKEYDAFAELFTEDGHLDAGGPVDGREAIRSGLARRSDRLRSRHVLTNVHIEVIDADHARGITYLSLYRHVGDESLAASPVECTRPRSSPRSASTMTGVLSAGGWGCSQRKNSLRLPLKATSINSDNQCSRVSCGPTFTGASFAAK